MGLRVHRVLINYTLYRRKILDSYPRLLKIGVQFRHHKYSNDGTSKFSRSWLRHINSSMGEKKYVQDGDQNLKKLILWCSFPWWASAPPAWPQTPCGLQPESGTSVGTSGPQMFRLKLKRPSLLGTCDKNKKMITPCVAKRQKVHTDFGRFSSVLFILHRSISEVIDHIIENFQGDFWKHLRKRNTQR